MNKALIILLLLIALIILGVSFNAIQQKPNIQQVKPTHEERVEVVEEKKSISGNKREETPQGFGQASWYDRSVCGERIYGSTCKTASGEVFDEEAYTMACSNDFALGDRVELCYLSKCITVECTDRGLFSERYGRTFDLSRGLFQSFADLGVGVINLEWKLIE